MRFLARSLAGLVMASLTLGLLAMAGHSIWSAIQARSADPGRPGFARERVFAVRVMEFEPQTVEPVLETFGEVRSLRTLELRAPAAGRVVEVAPELADGAMVAAGQLLLRIDPADARAARDLAAADLARAEADLREAARAVDLAHEDRAAAEAQAELRQRALDRQRDLVSRGVGTDAAVETAELALSSAAQAVVSRRQSVAQAEARREQSETALARARIQLAEAERRLANTELRAEFAGRLTGVSVVAGGLLNTNEKIGQIIDPDALEVAFRVSTAQYARLTDAEGRPFDGPVLVTLDVMGTEVYSTGRMSRVSAAVGEAMTGRLIYVSLDAPRGFRPGDFVALQVTEPAVAQVARLPATAVDASGEILVLGDDDRLRAARVEVVRRQGQDVLVRAPDLAGARVVAERGPNLGPGIRVRPLAPEADAATVGSPAIARMSSEAERRPGAGPAAGNDAGGMVVLDAERRARLVAFVEADTRMPPEARARVLSQLAADQVPAGVIARIESRIGG